MDIEKKLEEIIQKYSMEIDINNLLKEEIKIYLESQIGYDEKIGIMCAGRHTEHLLKDFNDLLHPYCLLDSDPQKVGTTIEGIVISDIKKYKDVDKIIISTTDYREEVKERLENLGFPREKMIDIYDYLNQNGLLSPYTYYSMQDNIYVPFIFLNNRYKSSGKESNYLYMLIKSYLNIRDIKTSLDCMEEYIEKGFEEKECIKELYNEVCSFMTEIKDTLAKRNKRDIIWFWQDALCFDWVEFMPFYQEERKKGLFFTNTYNSSVWTRCVYELIFNKRYEIDDDAWRDSENIRCDWIKQLEQRGYQCVRVSNESDNEVELMRDFDFRKNKVSSFNQATSQLYWTLINYIVNSKSPVCILAHSVIETHAPICSPDLEKYSASWSAFNMRFRADMKEKMMKNVRSTCKYLDGITEYTSELFGDVAVKIYMSDHGSALTLKSRRWNKDANHFNFIVVGGKIEPKECKGLFSLYQFDKVIEYILNPSDGNLNNIFQKEIVLQSVDVYNKNTIEAFIKLGFEEYCISFRGMQGEMDRYILLKTGKEIYNVFPDDYTNYINRVEYQDRINEYRKKVGTVFVGDDEEKFQYTHILYDFLKAGKQN